MTADEKFIYVIGNFKEKTYLQKYDPTHKKWTLRERTRKKEKRYTVKLNLDNSSAFYFGKKIYIFNGKMMQFYDTQKSIWKQCKLTYELMFKNMIRPIKNGKIEKEL